MRTWLVIYKEKGEVKSKVVMAKTFDDAVFEIWDKLICADIKAVFEVAK
jgi:hypothetical protein